MFQRVLVVCIGNICRSPLGERLLARACPELAISSAGLHAVVGASTDALASEVAEAQGISLAGHVARQFTSEIGAAHDLILVMEPSHKQEITARFPALSGRVMLFDQWTGARGISDPYRRSREFHQAVHQRINEAAEAWALRLRKA